MLLTAVNKKKSPPVEVVVVWTMTYMAEVWKRLSTVNSSEAVPVRGCALS